jgi:hypothetical protein
MYNKLFSKILDSSIWLAPDPHRLVWITFLAAMDEDGNVMFASAANVAARARVSREQAEGAIAVFEGPDPDSGDPDHDGRRIERFPGGWNVLNAAKYRALVTKAIIREQTRVRVANHRAKKTPGNDDVRIGNAGVTPSEALSLSLAASKAKDGKTRNASVALSDLIVDGLTEQTATEWLAHRKRKKAVLTFRAWGDVKAEAEKAGWALEAAICKAMGRGWTGLDASWLAKEAPPSRAGPAFDAVAFATESAKLLAESRKPTTSVNLVERIDD